jgi:hypothetical protein
MTLSQKKAFNPIVQGFGIMLILIAFLFIYASHFSILKALLLSPLICFGLWINFSSVHLFKNSNNELIRTLGVFPLIIRKKIDLTKYDCILIKSEKVSYSAKNTALATPFFGVEKVKDEYTALYLKYNRKYDFNLMIKSSKIDIVKFIKTELTPHNLPVFNGVLKKGHEIKL